MTFSALSGVSLNLSRLLLRTCRWILVKMSLSGKHCGSNGKFSSSPKLRKAKEPLHESNRVWKWGTVLLFVWLLGAAGVGSIWFFSALNDGSPKDEALNLSQDKDDRVFPEYLNVSKEQYHDLDSLFCGSDQVICLYLLNLLTLYLCSVG